MWKAGFEIELMAPAGASRVGLAQEVAARLGGRVQSFFHPQSEPSKVSGTPIFHNLTPGFRVFDPCGAWYADFVDDLTLKAGLDEGAASKPGWHRIVSDDARMLQLAIRQCSAEAPQHTVLEPLAALFGTPVDRHPSGMCKVVDARQVSVAIATSLPGERERPCEIVTAPLEGNRRQVLQLLLDAAASCGFNIPRESATHIHFDGSRLCTAGAISNLVRLFSQHGRALKQRFKTNPACVRLGPWPVGLPKAVQRPEFAALPWAQAVEVLLAAKPVKYCDFNILNMLAPRNGKLTFEVRILPTSLSPDTLLEQSDYFEKLLAWCADEEAPHRPIPRTLDEIS
jgi:Putative amidoligase enzyme